MYDAVIIGAGHNGLVTAFYLARTGLRVLMLEARALVGGSCVTEELIPGFKFSTCANLIWSLRPQILSDMQLCERAICARGVGKHAKPRLPRRFSSRWTTMRPILANRCATMCSLPPTN